MAVDVPVSLRKHYSKLLQKIDRCPRSDCPGDLLFQVLGEGSRVSGYVGDLTAAFRCTKCNMRFTITNPNSFAEDPHWFEKWANENRKIITSTGSWMVDYPSGRVVIMTMERKPGDFLESVLSFGIRPDTKAPLKGVTMIRVKALDDLLNSKTWTETLGLGLLEGDSLKLWLDERRRTG